MIHANKKKSFLPNEKIAPKALLICFISFLFALIIGVVGSISSNYGIDFLTKLCFFLAVVSIILFVLSFIYYFFWMLKKVIELTIK